jgi:hypothetical protein
MTNEKIEVLSPEQLLQLASKGFTLRVYPHLVMIIIYDQMPDANQLRDILDAIGDRQLKLPKYAIGPHHEYWIEINLPKEEQ